MPQRVIRILDIATQAPVDRAYIFRRGSDGRWIAIAQADERGEAVVTMPPGTALRFERVGYRPHEEAAPAEQTGRVYMEESAAELPPVVVERKRPKFSGWLVVGGLVLLTVLLSDDEEN